MLELVPDHLKAKKMCKHVVHELPFLIKYVSDRYKTQQMCYKAIPRNGGILMFIPENYKDQGMYNKAVDDYRHTLKSVPDFCKLYRIAAKFGFKFHLVGRSRSRGDIFKEFDVYIIAIPSPAICKTQKYAASEE